MLSTLLPAAADAAVPTTGQIFWSEFLGTTILLLLGGGVVATHLLPKSKGKGGGWLLINWGVGPGGLRRRLRRVRSGGHLNPAVTIAKVVAHMFDPKVTLAGAFPSPGTNVAVYTRSVPRRLRRRRSVLADLQEALRRGLRPRPQARRLLHRPRDPSYGWNCLTEPSAPPS